MRGYGRLVDATAQGTIVIGDDRLDPDGLRAAVATTAGRYAGSPVIAVVAEPTMRAVIAILAGMEAGSTVIPISPDAGPRERDHVLGDSGATQLDDASGDRLDAVLCLVQAAWATAQPGYGMPGDVDPVEGWIVTA
jgi:acyl-CoA synthetase (AMP-forming)/AMP-acid ligase II